MKKIVIILGIGLFLLGITVWLDSQHAEQTANEDPLVSSHVQAWPELLRAGEAVKTGTQRHEIQGSDASTHHVRSFTLRLKDERPVFVEEYINVDEVNGKETFSHIEAFSADRILVRLHPEVEQARLEALCQQVGDCAVVEEFGLPGLFEVEVQAEDVEEFRSIMEQLASHHTVIAYAEPDYLNFPASTPNDPLLNQQYAFDQIDALEAIGIAQGEGVVVGVIDDGVNYLHEDLAGTMWVNPYETPGDGIDNDGNGYIDDIHGADAHQNDGDPMPASGDIHGTFMAGIIAAEADNGLGIVGITPHSKIAALRVGSSTVDFIKALNHVVTLRNQGINLRVLNASFGRLGTPLQSEEDAIEAVGNAGVMLVAAAGNNNVDTDAQPNYPSGYTLDNIIAVGASQGEDSRAGFSNFGTNSVDVSAPGVSVLGTDSTGYSRNSGTSVSAPQVAGAIALMFSLDEQASLSEIKSAVLAGVDVSTNLAGANATSGRLNVYGALYELGLIVTASDPAADEIVETALQDFEITFSFSVDSSSVDSTDFVVNGLSADSWQLIDDNIIRFSYTQSPVVQSGVQTMSIAAGQILRLSDGRQNHAWSKTFRYDPTELTVQSMAPASGSTAPLPVTSLEIEWNEDIHADSLGVDDVIISQGVVTGFTQLNSRTIRYHLSHVISEGLLDVDILAGAVTDSSGNPCEAFSGVLHLDIDEMDFPVPLTAVNPADVFVVQERVQARLDSSADTDRLRLDLDENQMLSIVATGLNGQAPDILVEYDGSALASSGSENGISFLQGVLIENAGTYTIDVSGSGSVDYTLHTALNAVYEREQFTDISNDGLVQAEGLDNLLLSIGGDAYRGSVLGELSVSDGEDWYSVTLPPGDNLMAEVSDANLELYSENGSLISQDQPAVYQSSLGEVIYLRVQGDESYTLQLSRNAMMDVADNDIQSSAKPLGALKVAYGNASSFPTDGLVLYFPFDDSTSSVVSDQSGLGNDGVLEGDALYIESGVFGGSVEFDGNGDRVTVPNHASLQTPEVTYSIWVKSYTAYSGGQLGIFTKSRYGSGQKVNLQYAFDAWYLQVGNDSVFISQDFEEDQWIHLAVTVDSAVSRLYINGEFAGEAPREYFGPNTDADLTLGDCCQGLFSQDFHGAMDEFRMYNRALSPNEISQLYLSFDGGSDFYQFTAPPGEDVVLRTLTPGGGPYLVANEFDPMIRVFDLAGSLIAENDNGAADGRNADLTLSPTGSTPVTYVVEIRSSDLVNTEGAYILLIEGEDVPPYDSIAIAGNFNGWSPSQHLMQHDGGTGWSLVLNVDQYDDLQFKFTANQSWAENWGENDHQSISVPFTGDAESYGGNIQISGTTPGTYRIHFDSATFAYSIERLFPALQWAGHVWNWPYQGEAFVGDDIWINIETWPIDSAEGVEVYYTANGTDWFAMPMSWNGTGGNNDIWHVNLGSFNSATVLQYALRVQGFDGHVIWESNGGNDFFLSILDGDPVQWIGNSYHYPFGNSVSSGQDFWVNIESWPYNTATEADVFYTVDGGASWHSVSMVKNTPIGNNDAWHINMGTFAPGVTLQYAIRVRGGQGSELWDSNNGSDYFVDFN